MRYFDKTFFKFLVGFSLIIVGGLFFISKVQAQSASVNINTASLEELQTLNGIGPTIAQRIIDYRTGNGPFVLIEDIKNVSGIGDSIFERIRNDITVGSIAVDIENNKNNSNQTSSAITQNSTGASSGPVVRNIEYKILTEKEKFGTAGSPIDFSVKHNVGGKRVPVRWTFGDGSIAYGQNVTHTYEYPGEYVVVVSINAVEEKISARVNVSVSEDSIAVIEANASRVVVYNNGKKEVYLYGKKIVSGDSYFEFPEDMIIKPGQKIALSSKVTGLRISNASAVIKNLNDSHIENESLALNEEEKQRLIDQIIVLQNRQIEIKKNNEAQIASIGSFMIKGEFATTTALEKKGFVQKIKAFFRLK